MADIELVIKIPEGLKMDFESEQWTALSCMEMKDALKKATLLPKGHGDLIDKKAINSKRIRGITEFDKGYNTRSDEVDEDIANALVIVEADKGE